MVLHAEELQTFWKNKVGETVKTNQLLLDLIKFEINGVFQKENYSNIDVETTECLIELASKHSVLPLVLDALLKNGLYNDDTQQTFRQSLWLGVMLNEKQTAELKKLCTLFEENQICHIPLKGSVLRKYYPESWMRTCCDIDILVKPEELDRAVKILKNSGYTIGKKASHDISFYSKDGIHIEINYDAIERECNLKGVNNVLERIWKYAFVKDGYEFQFEMTSEMFYFFHLAHMAKHFVHGGCGIRPFIDIIFFKKNVNYDKDKLNSLLKESGISTFADMAEKLASIWFEGEEMIPLAEDMQKYIFAGGVYGNVENITAVNRARRGNRFKNIFSEIFLKYDVIKHKYPILKKYKFLLPFFEVKRWCKLIFVKRYRQRSISHLSANKAVSDEKVKTVSKLLEKLEL